jgi:YVTN family beta-propeller protein
MMEQFDPCHAWLAIPTRHPPEKHPAGSHRLLTCLVGLFLLLFASSSNAAEMRTWTGKNGKTLEAEFVKVEKGSDGRFILTLRKPDGSEMTVHPPVLIEDDLKYVREMVKSQKQSETKDEKPSTSTWRKTGEYPLIAGKWSEWEEGGIFVTIRQDSDKFVANCTYKNNEGVEVHWRAGGTISKDGEITANLVHTKPEGYASQVRTGKLEPDGNTIHGHAKWDGGECDFGWTLKETYKAGLAHAGKNKLREKPHTDDPDVAAKKKPSSSTSIALIPDASEVWTVNEDNDSVTALRVLDKAPYLHKLAEIPVGLHPRTLAVSPDGDTIYVANQYSASLAVIDRAQKKVLGFVGLGWASQPYGVVASPDGRFVYVSTYATAKVHKIDVTNRSHCQVVKSASVVRQPWALALTGDGRRLLVTQGINGGPPNSKDPAFVTRVDTESFDMKRIPLQKDETPDTGGYVSMLRSIMIAPAGHSALVACQHIDSDRGMMRDKKPTLSFKTEIQPVICFVGLDGENELRPRRIVLSKLGTVINTPSAIAVFSGTKKSYCAVVAQGSDNVKIIGLESGYRTEPALVRVGGVLHEFPSGAAPDGICVDTAHKRLYVLNLLNRSVSVIPIVEPIAETKEVAEIELIHKELLSPEVLRGKKVFFSSELGTSKGSWISCANCHPDGGGTDGRVWDFSQFGGNREGAARTLSLRGTTGYRGRLFWQGRADEVQDLENGVRLLFGGQLIPGKPNPNLGPPNAGLGKDFDAVAAYIFSQRRVQPSPFRGEDGQLTDEAKKGRKVFYEEGCDSCHLPALRFCDTSRSTPGTFIPHDVDTNGEFNTPSLVNTWENGAWLHDGRAASIRQAITGTSMMKSDRAKKAIDHLAAFTRSIDDGGDLRSPTGAVKDNQSPIIVVPHLQNLKQVEPGQPVSFLGSRSFDPDGNIVSWLWSFHDGSTGQEVEARSTFGDLVHVFPVRPATYRVSLKVTDDQGASTERSWYVGVGREADPNTGSKP